MNAQPARGYLGISEVLAQLRGDFPDISVSKIRFLETEGLITPARSPSGYRRFCAADVDRLRFILAAQRDQYLPLRVIKERLADAEPPDGDRLLSRRELTGRGGLSEALLTELETFGLLRRVGPQLRPGRAPGREDRGCADSVRRGGTAPARGPGGRRAGDHHDREPGRADPAPAGERRQGAGRPDRRRAR